MPAIRRGLEEAGFIEGRNLAMDIRWADGQLDRLPLLAGDLVHRQVAAMITTGGNASVRAAMAATATIPIIFSVGDDPVQAGLVASLSHPGGNATGVSLATTELLAKRVELLHDLVPHAGTIALFLKEGSGEKTTRWEREHAEAAARDFGLRMLTFEIDDSKSDFQTAFAAARQAGAEALLLSAAPFFMPHRKQIVSLAERYVLPVIYPWREFAEAGGLMSYGPDLAEAYRQVGRYAGRILNGEAPQDLPVQLPTKFELVINLKAAKALNLTVPRLMNARADKVIE